MHVGDESPLPREREGWKKPAFLLGQERLEAWTEHSEPPLL
ncbi:hypothetical protein [Ktedonobacter robiniae]|nr:hypothetical protein [Ktedonobacter robiniae]